jgi:hypothetical protein
MARRIFFLAVILAVLWLAAPLGATANAPFVFQTDMFGSNVVPPVQTGAWGFVRFFFNEDRTEADYTVDVKGLSDSLVSGADLRFGPPGVQGPVVRHLADGNFIVTSGRLRLNAAELADFVAGNYYVVLYTKEHPDGELRGQVYVPGGFVPGTAATGSGRDFAGIPAPTGPSQSAEVVAPVELVAPVQVAPPPEQAPAPRGLITPPNTGDAGLAASKDAARSIMAGLSAVIIGVALLFVATAPHLERAQRREEPAEPSAARLPRR